MKRMLAILLTVAMALSMNSMAVFASSKEDVGDSFPIEKVPSQEELRNLLSKLYQRNNGQKMLRENPLETITVEQGDAIHRPSNWMPLPKLSSNGGVDTYVQEDDSNSGPFDVEDERFFRMEVRYTSGTEDVNGNYRAIKGRLLAQGANTNVWVADDEDFHSKSETVHDSEQCKLLDVTTEMAIAMATNFDGIYQRMTDDTTGFGPFNLYEAPYSNLSKVGDLGADKHVNILLYDIDALDQKGGGYTGGYFWAYDMFSSNQDFDDSEMIDPIDLFHVDIGAGQGWNSFGGDEEANLQIYGTLAHEFQHMLFFTHFGVYPERSDIMSNTTWFNESLSGLADVYFTKENAEVIDLTRTAYAATNPYDGSGYGDLMMFNGSFKNYGMGYLFSAFYHNFTGGKYGHNVYQALTTGDMANDGTIEAFARKSAIVNNAENFPLSLYHVGAMLNGGLALPPDINEDKKVDSSDYYLSLFVSYLTFMENFASDGGKLIYTDKDGQQEEKMQKLLRGTELEQNLWDLRPLLGDPASGLHSLEPIPTLASGSSIVMEGYYNLIPKRFPATHDMLYKLEGSGAGIDITIPDAFIENTTDKKNVYYYLILKNREGVYGADIFPLETGVENHIENDGREAYLFATTFFNPINRADHVVVTYKIETVPLTGGIITPGQSKVYDGTTSFSGINVTFDASSGVLEGDTVTAIVNGTVEDASVGTGKALTVTSATLSGVNAGKYSLPKDLKEITGTVAIVKENGGGGGGSNSGGSSGSTPTLVDSTKVVAQINSAQAGSTVTIAMKGATSIPSNILTAAKSADVNLLVDYGTYTWTIKGESIGPIPANQNYNLKVETIKDSKLSVVADSKDVLQIELAHNGALPFTGILSYPMNTKYNNKDMDLLYFNEAENQLNYTGSGKVKEGKISLSFNHASKYVLTSYDPKNHPSSQVTNPFTDVKSTDWFYDAVMTSYEKGLFKGTSDTTFSPNLPVTRGMFLTVLARLDGEDLSKYTSTSFDDVNIEAYDSKAIEWAAEMGIAKGISAELFAPKQTITREEMATMMDRYVEKKNIVLQKKETTPVAFADEAEISPWARESVATMQSFGIMNGIGGNLYNPKGIATRAEASQIFLNFLNAMVV